MSTRKKQIVIICGTGIATSTVVATKVEALLKKHNIPAYVRQGKAVEAQSMAEHADLVVTTIPKLQVAGNVPVVIGIGFLNGIGVPELEKKILEKLTGEE
ncbi:MAG: PTS sugar transporter subunit IIB [Anaerolineaceae bacterium]|jgi:PTS system galactitol-specific IIB component